MHAVTIISRFCKSSLNIFGLFADYEKITFYNLHMSG